MTWIPLLLLSLAACRTAPQEKPAAPDSKHTLEAAVRETPPREKDPPGLVCDGTTSLPDGCRVDIEIYFGTPVVGRQVQTAAEEVKGGKFSTAFILFPKSKKNLAGAYIVRLKFNPGLQRAQFNNLPPAVRDVPLKIGSDEDAAIERRSWSAGLLGEMKAIAALAEEAAALRREGKLDAAGWDAHLAGWSKRSEEINRRVLGVPEYQVLGYGALISDGFEKITGTSLDVCRFCKLNDPKHMRDGRERLDVALSTYEDYLTGRPLDPKKEMLQLAERARTYLKAAATSNDDKGPLGRKMFRQTMLDLNRLVDIDVRPTILEISASVNQLFDAIDEKKDGAELHATIDARLVELVKALQNQK